MTDTSPEKSANSWWTHDSDNRFTIADGLKVHGREEIDSSTPVSINKIDDGIYLDIFFSLCGKAWTGSFESFDFYPQGAQDNPSWTERNDELHEAGKEVRTMDLNEYVVRIIGRAS